MSAPTEPTITVQGSLLTFAQAMTFRLALGDFIARLQDEARRPDAAMAPMDAALLARAQEIEALLFGENQWQVQGFCFVNPMATG